MTRLNRELIIILSKLLQFPEPICDMGSLQVSGQEGFADLRPFFPNKRFIGVDMRKGPGVDSVQNLESLNFEDNSIGSIICLDTFEHIKRFWKVSDEFYRILKPKGFLLLLTVGEFPIHEFPQDYWRFTPEGIRSLTERYKTNLLFSGGKVLLPKVVGSFCSKTEIESSLQNILISLLKDWGTQWKGGLE